jgi:hypothetical protein
MSRPIRSRSLSLLNAPFRTRAPLVASLLAVSVAASCGSGPARPPQSGPSADTASAGPSAAASAVPSAAASSGPSATASAEPTTPASSATTAAASATAQPSTSAVGTSAPSAAAPTGPVPPDEAALGRRFREPSPLSHVRAFVIDEACLLQNHIPREAERVQTSTIGLEDFVEGDVHRTCVETRDDSPRSLVDLRAFVGAFPKDKHRFAIDKSALQVGSNTTYYWRAYCLQPTPLFGGSAELGRIKHKDGTYDEDRYRVGLAPAAIAKIQALPKEARRLIMLYDDDVLVVLPVDQLKALQSPTLTLVKMEAAK